LEGKPLGSDEGAAVRVVFPETFPNVAAMVVAPAETAVASPPELTVATAVCDEVQLTCVVKSLVVASEYVPVAVNCCVAPTAMLGLAGVTAMEASEAAVIFKVAAAVAPALSVIV